MPSAPSSRRFVDPFQNPALVEYMANVRAWHGYIRFLGLPHLRDNPDVPIDRLFVEPRLSDAPLSPDQAPKEREKTISLPQALSDPSKPLVVLGDPGSGKSTLVNWLAWNLARPGENDWTRRLGRLAPAPMVLRELKIDAKIDADGLLDAFLGHEMAEPLDISLLNDLLARGQALVMLDGLDEIGGKADRDALRGAVFELLSRYPSCLWLLTSRIVGYEMVPFHKPPSETKEGGKEPADPPPAAARRPGEREPGRAFYAAPFDDGQIARFARNWYVQREAAGRVAEEKAGNLVEAIHAHAAILRLARIPNLLTMMAQIHRIRARLPDGKAKLYDDISQAYLQSIDEYRGLLEVDHPLAQKKRWLARVGFEMQCRRPAPDEESEDGGSRPGGILARQTDIMDWIVLAMEESGFGGDPEAAASFLDYIGRRSGLLLPRGEERFAFMHLSLQEYFAACFLADDMTSPQGGDREALRGYADRVPWRETLIFLFELMADSPGWPAALAEILFGKNFRDVEPGGPCEVGAAFLLAQLALNPHSGFSPAMRGRAMAVCARREAEAQKTWRRDEKPVWLYGSGLLRTLLAAEPGRPPPAWGAFIEAVGRSGTDMLTLSGCSGVENVGALAGMTLLILDLDGTGVTDLRPLAKLTALESLYLDRTGVTDLRPLAKLTALEGLYLLGTGVTDLRPLAKLTALEGLLLAGTGVTDLRPLAKLTALGLLYLNRTGVTDLRPLAKLTTLEYLYLDWTGVTDLRPLAKLTALEHLDLGGTGVTDLRPLAKLTALKHLFLHGTGVTDLRPLAKLTALEHLDLNGTDMSKNEVAALRSALPELSVLGYR